MPDRRQLAERIAFGLGGWFQTLASQSIHDQAGEDAAKLMAIQILNAQKAYVPRANACPPNWGNARQRIDIAIQGRTSRAVGWYGAVEMKWPGRRVDADQTREAIVQDALRLSFVDTASPCANLLVVGGPTDTFELLFERRHPRAHLSENKRDALVRLLKRKLQDPDGMLRTSELSSSFPHYAERVPKQVFRGFDGGLKTILLASCDVRLGATGVGHVYVWRCKRARGTQTADHGHTQHETAGQEPRRQKAK